MDAAYGPVVDLADWLEDQPNIDATLIYVGDSADPGEGQTTLTFRPYGADIRPDPGHSVQRIQLVGRGSQAHAQMMQCYTYLNGLELALPDGLEITVVPLQSAPVFLNTEDTGGGRWTQNYSLEWANG